MRERIDKIRPVLALRMIETRMRHTQLWQADVQADLEQAAAALASGGVVAFPTETVYGLGADARNSGAVARIFEAKGRPSDNPLIVHLASAEALDELTVQPDELARMLMRVFWPGPLTLVLPVRPGAVSPLVTAGLDTVAVRMPAHETARRLIALAGCPIAAPSANRSGRPSPTTAAHVREDLSGRIDGVLDGGATGIGLESTVVSVSADTVHILRPGGVTREQLQAATGPGVQVLDAVGGSAALEAADRPRSPGVKYTHYAPQGRMQLVTGDDLPRLVAAVKEAAAQERRQGCKVGIIACSEHADRYRGAADEVLVLGARQTLEDAAGRLYSVLRDCDRLGLEAIIAEGYPESGIGAALMNRLRKAAGGREHSI